jgi:hypothetical protein
MIFNIDYEFEDRGIYFFDTDLGTKYKVSFKEGDYTVISISVSSYGKFSSEVFTTIQTLKFILNKVKSTKFVVNFDDRDMKIRRRKINILKRCLPSFDFSIVDNPHLPPIGRATSNTILNITQVYLFKKFETVKRKYCTNCGTEDTGYKFCPNCGTNLKV